MAVIEAEKRGEAAPANLLTTNHPSYVKHFNSHFEELWNGGLDAEARIREIESGSLSDTDVILSPERTWSIYKKMVSNAVREVLLVIPTCNAFLRARKIGVIDALEKVVAGGAKGRILAFEDGMQIRDIAILESRGVQVRHLPGEQSMKETNPRITMVIVDGKESLVIELKDDEREFEQAVGPAVISTSGPIVVSHARIFESLWREAELVARLQDADRLQREFISVAAHELKTPIQPILVMAYLLGIDEPEGTDDEEEVAVKRKYLSIIFRNAKRLQQLSSHTGSGQA